MATNTMDFCFYRLNYEHKPNLFNRHIRNDDDLVQVLRGATDPARDVVKSRSNSGFQWALREFHLGNIDEDDRREYGVLTLAKSSLYKAGTVVTDFGFETAISTSNPALAERILILIDLKRHLFAVEYNSALMQSNGWRKELERMLTRSSQSLGFYTRLLLVPVAPREGLEHRLREFQKITKIKLTLSLPNPDISATYERLYNEMVKGGVKQLKQELSNPDGLSLEEGTLPNASLSMAMNGYKRGDIKIRGMSNGRSDGFTIGEEVTRAEVQGVREFADGISQGSNERRVKHVIAAILKKIDEILVDPADGNERGGFR